MVASATSFFSIIYKEIRHLNDWYYPKHLLQDLLAPLLLSHSRLRFRKAHELGHTSLRVFSPAWCPSHLESAKLTDVGRASFFTSLGFSLLRPGRAHESRNIHAEHHNLAPPPNRCCNLRRSQLHHTFLEISSNVAHSMAVSATASFRPRRSHGDSDAWQ